EINNGSKLSLSLKLFRNFAAFLTACAIGLGCLAETAGAQTKKSKSNKKEIAMSQTSATPQSGNEAVGQEAIRPFKVSFPESELTELRRRIKATKWPERETVNDDTQGVRLAVMQKLADYWANKYDWRKVEAKINSYPNFVTNIDGLDIHFIHVKSKEKNAMPIIITHGWPGSIIEQLKIID